MKLPPEEIKKIGIFRALQLGDLLCAIPAIRALRHAYPQAEIVLIGLPWAASFVQRFHHYFDRFIPFPGYSGLPEQTFDEALFFAFRNDIREEKFDLLIQMQGNGTIVNTLLLQFEAKHLAGFYNEESFINSDLFILYPGHGPEKYRHLALMRHLGIDWEDESLEFPLMDEDKKEYDKLLMNLTPKSYIVVHPGSRGSWRQWPPKFFAAIADFAMDEGFIVVITGTSEESDITSEVTKCMHRRPVNLTGKTSLGAVGVLIQNAFALLSNCTGVSHMADAFRTPSLIISMDGEPDRWSPVNKELHIVIDWTTDPSFRKVVLKSKHLLEVLRGHPAV